MIVGLGRIMRESDIDHLIEVELYLRDRGVSYKVTNTRSSVVLYFEPKQIHMLDRDIGGYYLGETARFSVQEIRDADLI